MPIDWLNASTEDRRTLYRAVKRLMDEEGLSWTALYRAAFGPNFTPGHGYEDNFRSGRIDRKKAHRLAVWMMADHPDHAAKLDGSASPAPTISPLETAWDRLVAARGVYGVVRAVRLPRRPTGIVAFTDTEPLARPVLGLGAPFCFQLEGEAEGWVIAFQQVEGRWHLLPLARGRLAVMAASQSFLPADPKTGGPIALSEDAHTGRHRFVFVVGDQATVFAVETIASAGSSAARLDQIAHVVADADAAVTLARINLLFVASDGEGAASPRSVRPPR